MVLSTFLCFPGILERKFLSQNLFFRVRWSVQQLPFPDSSPEAGGWIEVGQCRWMLVGHGRLNRPQGGSMNGISLEKRRFGIQKWNIMTFCGDFGVDLVVFDFLFWWEVYILSWKTSLFWTSLVGWISFGHHCNQWPLLSCKGGWYFRCHWREVVHSDGSKRFEKVLHSEIDSIESIYFTYTCY